jgi:hypothetical protein
MAANFVLSKANFAAIAGRYGEKFNAAQYKICPSQPVSG